MGQYKAGSVKVIAIGEKERFVGEPKEPSLHAKRHAYKAIAKNSSIGSRFKR
jgi:hypothetical protein